MIHCLDEKTRNQTSTTFISKPHLDIFTQKGILSTSTLQRKRLTFLGIPLNNQILTSSDDNETLSMCFVVVLITPTLQNNINPTTNCSVLMILELVAKTLSSNILFLLSSTTNWAPPILMQHAIIEPIHDTIMNIQIQPKFHIKTYL